MNSINPVEELANQRKASLQSTRQDKEIKKLSLEWNIKSFPYK